MREPTPRRPPYALLFFVLILPFGLGFGYPGAFPRIAERHGVDVKTYTAIVALAYQPHAWKFLWAPLIDGTLTRRAWCAIGIVLTAIGTIVVNALPVAPGQLGAVIAVVVAMQLGVSLVGTSCDGLIAVIVPHERKGGVAGWYQAGAFVGTGVGAGLILFLVAHLRHSALVGLALGLPMLACALPLVWLDEPAPEARGAVWPVVRNMVGDIWRTVKTRHGFTGLLIALSPVGAGALANLFTGAFATDFHAGEHLIDVLATVTSLVGAVGCIAGGWIADRINRRLAYALAGIGTAVVAFALLPVPRTPAMYTVGTLAYSLFNGVAFATFSAFVLDTIGGGAAAATKYTVFASLANNAISYMTALDGRAHARWHLRGALLMDGLGTLAGVVVLLVLVRLLRAPRRSRSRAVA